MGEFFLGIMEITIGMSILILLMLFTLKLIGGKFTAKCRYILWTLVMIRLAVPVSFGILPALIEVPVETEQVQQIQMQAPTVNYTPTQQNPITVQPQEQIPTPTVQTPVFTEPEPDPLTWEDVKAYIPHTYLAGAAVFLLWNLLAYGIYTAKILRLARESDAETQAIYEAVCRKKGMRRVPKLLVSSDVNSPAAFGLLFRRIVLPDIALTENGLTGTLSHEVTHCKRGDLWIKAICLLARSFHWFNPLVHLAALKCEMEMELSCDEAVLAGCDENTRAVYGEVMLDIIKRCRRNRGALTTHFNPKKNAVKARFTNILYGSGKRRGLWLIAVCLVLCLIAGAIVACRTEKDIVNETVKEIEDVSTFKDALAFMSGQTEVDVIEVQVQVISHAVPTEPIPLSQENAQELLGMLDAIPFRFMQYEPPSIYGATSYTMICKLGNGDTVTMCPDGNVLEFVRREQDSNGVWQTVYYCLIPDDIASADKVYHAVRQLWNDAYSIPEGETRTVAEMLGEEILEARQIILYLSFDGDTDTEIRLYADTDVHRDLLDVLSGLILEQCETERGKNPWAEIAFHMGEEDYRYGEHILTKLFNIWGECLEISAGTDISYRMIMPDGSSFTDWLTEWVYSHKDQEGIKIVRWNNRLTETSFADPAAIWQTFLDTVVSPYSDYIVATEYLDLDGNSIDELIIYNWGASANCGIEIFTIENGEVRSFSTGTNGITHDSEKAKSLAPPSANAVTFSFWGLPTSYSDKSDTILWFTPCTGRNGHVLYSMNGSDVHTSEDYYYFTTDANGNLTVEVLRSYYCEAIDSNPANGWKCYIFGEEVSVRWFHDTMGFFWQDLSVSHGVKYHNKNTASRYAELEAWMEPPLDVGTLLEKNLAELRQMEGEHYRAIEAILSSNSSMLEVAMKLPEGTGQMFTGITLASWAVDRISDDRYFNPIRLTLEITESSSSIFPVGTSRWIVDEGMDGVTLTDYENPVVRNPDPTTDAEEAVWTWLRATGQVILPLNTEMTAEKKAEFGKYATEYACRHTDGTLESIRNMVKTCFGSEEYFSDEILYTGDGVHYGAGAHGAARHSYDWLGTTENKDGSILVKMLFYADPSKFIPAKTVDYTLVPTREDGYGQTVYFFRSCEVVEDTGYSAYLKWT